MTVNVAQISRLRIETNGKIVDVICDSDMPLGLLHDVLMQHKGWVIERMINAQKEEEGASEMLKEKSEGTAE